MKSASISLLLLVAVSYVASSTKEEPEKANIEKRFLTAQSYAGAGVGLPPLGGLDSVYSPYSGLGGYSGYPGYPGLTGLSGYPAYPDYMPTIKIIRFIRSILRSLFGIGGGYAVGYPSSYGYSSYY